MNKLLFFLNLFLNPLIFWYIMLYYFIVVVGFDFFFFFFIIFQDKVSYYFNENLSLETGEVIMNILTWVLLFSQNLLN